MSDQSSAIDSATTIDTNIDTPLVNPMERLSYRFFAQGLDEDFNDMRNMNANRAEMESHPVGTPEHHIAAAKMFGNIINHSRDMVKLHTEVGETKRAAFHSNVIKNAAAEASHHLAQYHFAMANRHANAGDMPSAISHQIKGEKEMETHNILSHALKDEE